VADSRYHELLGVDPDIEADKPDFFQLLGVDQETDEDDIAKKFKDLMRNLQKLKGGKHKGFVEFLKEELRKAKLTLTNDKKRREYLEELEEEKKDHEIEEFKEQVKNLFILGEISKTLFDKLVDKGKVAGLTASKSEAIIDALAEKEGVVVKKLADPKPEPVVETRNEERADPQDSHAASPLSLPPEPAANDSGSPRPPATRPEPSRRPNRLRPPPTQRGRANEYPSEHLIRPPMAPRQRHSAISSRPNIAPPQQVEASRFGGPPEPAPTEIPRPPQGQFPNQPRSGTRKFSNNFYGDSSQSYSPPQNPSPTTPAFPNPYGHQAEAPQGQDNQVSGRKFSNNFYGDSSQSYSPPQNEAAAPSSFPSMFEPSGQTPASTQSPQSNFYNQPHQGQANSGRVGHPYSHTPNANPVPTLSQRVSKEPDYPRKLKEVVDTFNRGSKSVKMGYKCHHELQWYFPPKNKRQNAITYQLNGVGYDKVFDIEMKMYREAQRCFEQSRKLSMEYNIREGLPQSFFDRLEKGIRSLKTYQESGREIKVRLLGSVQKTEQLRIWSDFLGEMRAPEYSEPIIIKD
jgi:hypothetical protein